MNFIQTFKEYLMALKPTPSQVTVKNYCIDVKHFITWAENKFHEPFNPQKITLEHIQEFKQDEQQHLSLRSLERHVSSLRKFFLAIKLQGVLTTTPFEEVKKQVVQETDPFQLKKFKDFLYVYNASTLTIKNYIIDVRQFLTWAQEVTKNENIAQEDLLARIDDAFVATYRDRLVAEKVFSPSSINRKLSSLRKYLSWAASQNLVTVKEAFQNNLKTTPSVVSTPNLPLPKLPVFEAKSEKTEMAKAPANSHPSYSAFPPFRLAQKLNRVGLIIFDTVIILPLTHTALLAQKLLWQLKGKPLFVKSSLVPAVKTNGEVKNLPKSLFAPLQLSLDSLSFYEKLIFHAKHTRPNWYKRYHSYVITTYFHWAILLIFTTAIGFGFYNSFVSKPNNSQPALAAAPPRILSFQGRLTDTNNNPITTSTNLRFAIYNDLTASGSALQWQEVDNVTPDANGVFSVLLGSGTTIPQSLFGGTSNLYIGITVGQTTELTPRQQLATVAYATNAETLQGLQPITNAGGATSNVVLALDGTGNLTIGGSATPVFTATGGQFTLAGKTLTLSTVAGSNTNVQLAPDGTGIIDAQKPIQNTTKNNNIPSAVGAVEIDDLFAVLATSSGQSAATINQNGSGPIISASASGAERFTVSNSGTIKATGYTTGGGILFTDTTGLIMQTAAGINGQCLTSTGGGTPTWGNCGSGGSGINYWTLASGSIYPVNTTLDVFFGGTSTQSANFAFLNNASGTPTASIAGNLTLNNANGSIQSTNNQPLTLGGNTTGGITLSPNNGSGTVSVNGSGLQTTASTFNLLTTTALTVNIAQAATALNLGATGGTTTFASSAINDTQSTVALLASPTTITFGAGATSGLSLGASSGTTTIQGAGTINGNTVLGTNNTNTITANGLFNSDILPSGNGTINLGSSTHYFNTVYANNFVAPITGGTSGFWSLTNDVVFPSNTFFDLAVGGTSTASAAWQVYSENYGSIIAGTATSSGGLTFRGATTNVDLLNNSSLNIQQSVGGDTGLSSVLYIQPKTGNIGLGNTNPSAFKLETAGSIGPTVTDTYDLGSASLEWNNLYVKNIVSTGSVSGFLQRNLGVISPLNIADDLSIGGVSTTSAKFQIFGNSGNATTAGTLTFSGTGSLIQTVNNQLLTIGGNTTGGITLSPNNGNGTVNVNGSGLQTTASTFNLFTSTATNLNLGVTGGITTVNSGLTITGTITPNGQFGASLIPNSTSVNLGSSSNYFGSAYITNLFPSGSSQYLGFWQLNSGVLSPTNTTNDLAIGGTATAGAKFQIFSTGNATTTGSLTFNSGAQATNLIAARNLQGLTIGDSQTGNITFNGGTLTVNGLGTGVVQSTGGLLSTGNVNLTSEVTGILPIANGGTNANAVGASGSIAYSTGTAYAFSSAGTSGYCLVSGGSSAPTWQSCSSAANNNYWTLNNGTLYPINTTLDVFLGGTSSSSANFAFLNNAAGTPTASISGNLTLNSAGQIQTTKNQALTIGGNTTGNIILSPNNGTGAVTVNGSFNSTLLPTTTDTYNLGSSSLEWNNLFVKNIITSGGVAGFLQRNLGVLSPTNITDDFAIGGTATSTAKFQVFGTSGNATTAGNLTFTGTGSQIQTVNNQALTLGGNTTGNIILSPNNGSGSVTINGSFNSTLLPTTTDTYNLGSPTQEWNNIYAKNVFASGSIAGFWQRNFGAISPTNSTDDILAGGTATSSAKFAVLNMTGSGTPTASVSSGLNGTGMYFDANGNVQTVNNGTLTLGGSTTGAITFGSHVGSSILPSVTNTYDLGSLSLQWNNVYANNIYQNGQPLTQLWQRNLGVLSPINRSDDIAIGGTSTSAAKFQVFGNTGNATTAGNLTFNTNGTIQTTSMLPLVLGSATTGPIQLSPKGTTGLFVDGSGNVGIGTTVPSDVLDVIGNGSAIKTETGTGITARFFCASTTSNCYAGSLTNNNFVLRTNDSDRMTILAGGNVGINTTNPGEKLDVNGNLSVNTGTAGYIKLYGSGNSGFLQSANSNFLFSNNAKFDGTNWRYDQNGFAVQAQTEGSTGNFYVGVAPSGSSGSVISFTYPFMVKNNGNVGIGTVSPISQLDVEGNVIGKAQVILNEIGGDQNILVASASGTTEMTLARNGALSARQFIDLDNVSYLLDPAATGTSLTVAGSVGIGTTIPLNSSAIDIEKNGLGNADVIINQQGNGDILTASSAGTTKFTVQNDGTIIATKYTTQAGILYMADTAGTVAETAQGSTGQCLISNGSAAPSWAACATGAAGINWWNVNNGTVYPINSTLDLLIGGNATTSAKFAVTNMSGPGTPTASISSGLNGNGTYFTAAGVLQTTNNQGLTIGGNSTGNITIAPLNGGTGSTLNLNAATIGTNQSTVNLFNSTPTTVNFAGAANALTIGGVGGTTTFASANIDDNQATVALLATPTTVNFAGGATTLNIGAVATTLNLGASSGTTTVKNALTVNGNVTLGTNNSNTITPNGLFNADLIPTGNGSINLGSSVHYYNTVYANNFIAPVNNGIAGFWTLNTSLLFPVNTYYDLGVGGNATGSAMPWQVFATTAGVNTAGTATSSGGLTFRNTGGTQIALLNGGGLNVKSSLGGDAGLATILSIANNGDINQTGNLTSSGNVAANGGTLSTNQTTAFLFNTTATTVNIAGGASTGVNLGHASGTTLLRGNLTLGSNATNTINVVGEFASSLIPTTTNAYDVGTASLAWRNLYLTGNYGGLVQRFSGVVSPYNITDDLAIGGTSTSSALFQVFGNSGNATTSGTLTFRSNGTIQTTSMLPLILGSSTTGSIQLSPKGSTGLFVNGSGNVGVGTTNPANFALQVAGNLGPDATNSYDLGSNTIAWRNFYLSGNYGGFWQRFNGTVAPYNITDDFLLGGTATTSAKFAVLNMANGTPVASVSSGLNGNGLSFDANGNIQTTNNQGLTVGGSTTGDLALKPLNGSAGAYTTSYGDIIPDAADTRNLGSATSEWNNLYVRQIITPNGGGIAGYWQLNSGVLAPTNLTNDIAIGGVSTGSAKFQIFANSGNATTAGNLTFSSNGTIQTTSMLPLTIGSATTGAIQLSPKGTAGLYLTGTGSVGIGTTTNLGNAQLVVNQTNPNGDLFTASASATTKFVINNNGNVAIGPSYTTAQGILDVASSGTNLPSDLVLGQTTATNWVANPSFEGTSPLSGWTPTSGSGAYYTASTPATESAVFGVEALKFNNPGAGVTASIASACIPVFGSTQYTVSAYINRLAGFNGNTSIGWQEYTSTNCSGSVSVTGTNVGTTSTTGWTRVNESFTTGSTTQSMQVRAVNDGSASGTAYYDGFQLERGATATPYLDGSLGSGYSWDKTGTPNATDSSRLQGTAFAYQTLNSASGIGAAGRGTAPVLQLDQDGTGYLIAASTSGSTKFVVTNGGNVGIGTANPAGQLHLYANSNATNKLLIQNANSGSSALAESDYIGNAYQYNLGIASSGNTTIPNDFYLWDNNRSTYSYLVNPLGGFGTGVGNNTQIGNAAMVVNQLNLSGSGDIYVGSSSGSLEFKVSNSGVVTASSFQDLQNSNYFLDPASTGTAASLSGSLTFAPGTGSTNSITLLNNSNLNFQQSVGGDAGVGSVLYLQASTGNVGIGTTNPGAHLEIDDLSGVSFRVGATSHAGFEYSRASGDFYLGGDNSQAGNFYIKDSGGNTKIALNSDAASYITGGNVGVNTTQLGKTFEVNGELVAKTADSGGVAGTMTPDTNGLNFWINSSYNPSSPSTGWTKVMTIATSGKVGIGSTSPAQALDVSGQLAIRGVPVLDTLSGTETYIKTGGGTFHFQSPNGTNVANITSAGNMILKGTLTQNGAPSDVAEGIHIEDSSISAGDILTSGDNPATVSAQKSTTPYQKNVIGIVSTKPGILLNAESGLSDTNQPTPVIADGLTPLVLAGRVPTKVTSKNGNILNGDPITSSNVEGFGMKATEAGITVGTALESFTPSDNTCPLVSSVDAIQWPTDDGTNYAHPCYKLPDGSYVGKIMTQVKVMWFDPTIYLTTTGDITIAQQTTPPSADFTVPSYYTLSDALQQPITRMGTFLEVAVGNLRAGSIQAQQTITNTLAVATDNVSIAGQSLSSYIVNVVKTAISNGTLNGSLSPIASVDQLHTNLISPLASDSAIAVDLSGSKFTIRKNASGSAVASIDASGNATFSGTLNSQNLAVNADATISGTLHAGKIVADDIVGLQEAMGTLYAQNITNVTNIYFATPSGTPATPDYAIGQSFSSSSTSGALIPNLGYTNIASYSSFLAYVPTLSASTATFDQGLNSLGTTVLSDTTVTGQLSIGASLTLADNSINVLGQSLEIQPLRQGGVNFEGGLLAIDTDGNLTVNGNAVFGKTLAAHIISPLSNTDNLTFQLGQNPIATGSSLATANLSVENASGSGIFSVDQLGNVVASGAANIAKLNFNLVQPALAVSDTEVIASGSAGTASINAHQTEVTIDNPLVTDKSLIYITPVGQSVVTPYLIRQVNKTSFTVGISLPQNVITNFNWLIVN